MSAANITFRANSGADAFTSLTLTNTAGTPSDPITFEAWNTFSDALGELATEVRLHFYERLVGEAEWNQSGDAVANRWIEILVTGTVSGDAESYSTGWVPVGIGMPLRLRPIPANSSRQIQIRCNALGGAFNYVFELNIRPEWNRRFTPLEVGGHAAGQFGIASGVGDVTRSFIISAGGIAATGTPDDTIHLDGDEWLFEGEIVVDLTPTLVFDAEAADGTLGASEEYWATLSRNASGTLTVTKSDGGASPLGIDQRPEPPAGELLRAYVRVTNALEIAQDDIYDVSVLGSFGVYGTGLVRSAGNGIAFLADRMVDPDQPDVLDFPASEAEIEVFLTPSGNKVASTSGAPEDRSMLLYRAATDADDLTDLEDVRPFLRIRAATLSFRFDATLADDDKIYRSLVAGADAILTYPIACSLILDDLGTGNTAGRAIFDVEFWDGAAWVSIFTSSGTVDRRPTVEFDSALLTASGIPEVRRFAGFAGNPIRFRASYIEDEVFDGIAPSGSEVQLHFEIPGT